MRVTGSHRRIQRRCACGGLVGPTGECAACRTRRLEREQRAPQAVSDVVRSPGRPLEPGVRGEMEQRFRHDFSRVRVHTDARAAESARAVSAVAYAVGRDVVFDEGRYAPGTTDGKRLLAHELAHVVQQRHAATGIGNLELDGQGSRHEGDAERVAGDVVAGRSSAPTTLAPASIQRVAAPYIKKITVNLKPPQSAALEWEGTPPASAPGSDSFTVSTGKGYGDPDDPPGTCSRNCCTDPDKQCAPPWNEPGRVGACCTYHGSGFWTGTPEAEHGGPGGWKYWTPIQPYYSKRHIALHEHYEVTGQPIGHGCVRMAEDNAHRIYEYSRGRHTRVDIEGRAAPVLCEESRRCGARTSAEEEPQETRVAAAEVSPVEGLEGEMS